jgi:hypothetical protein
MSIPLSNVTTSILSQMQNSIDTYTTILKCEIINIESSLAPDIISSIQTGIANPDYINYFNRNSLSETIMNSII